MNSNKRVQYVILVTLLFVAQKIHSFSPPYNSNEQSLYVELFFVVDNGSYKELNQSLNRTYEYCKNVTKVVNSIYSQLNIFVALVGVEIWTEKNKFEPSGDIRQTLRMFDDYRNNQLKKDRPDISFDNTQFITNKISPGYGLACRGGRYCSTGVFTFNKDSMGNGRISAHELAHNFGVRHDADVEYCVCSKKPCLMSGSGKHWSNCSVAHIASFKKDGKYKMLENLPKSLFGSPTCGNGFLETGEECDCGLPEDCKNKCCDPKTCKFRSNATCAQGKCCDLKTCQLHEAGFECRSSAGDCDLPEYCNGKSESCPANFFKRDSEECEGGKAFCFKGSCKPRDDKCKQDGSKCGEKKICVSRKCVPIETIRRGGEAKHCQRDCNKHGVCNNNGHCHCDAGLAPPFCDYPGLGGSLDSGPASKPSGGLVLIPMVFFLAVIPFTVICLLVLYVLKLNGIWLMSQSEYESTCQHRMSCQCETSIKSTSLNQVLPRNASVAGKTRF